MSNLVNINRLSTQLIIKVDEKSNTHDYWLDSVLFANSICVNTKSQMIQIRKKRLLKALYLKVGLAMTGCIGQGIIDQIEALHINCCDSPRKICV